LLVADLFWEKSTAGWWQINQANSLTISQLPSARLVRQRPSRNLDLVASSLWIHNLDWAPPSTDEPDHQAPWLACL
jgi:hypothetical protein